MQDNNPLLFKLLLNFCQNKENSHNYTFPWLLNDLPYRYKSYYIFIFFIVSSSCLLDGSQPPDGWKIWFLDFSEFIPAFRIKIHAVMSHQPQSRTWILCRISPEASDTNTGVCLALRQLPNYWRFGRYRRSSHVQVLLKLGVKGRPQTCVQDDVNLMGLKKNT